MSAPRPKIVKHESASDEVAYWICPPRSNYRHATMQRPGALIHGSSFEALCGETVKAPWPTPNDRQPQSKLVTDRCDGCSEAVKERGARSRTWDF
ncbi:hypothetical protein BJ970_000139 [Saccharopolyspora phatthalungensis]|uniref:Uncharacterized protein n=1 Tax=Saccharopolyspora phatthalungensis TaxID=664693 RepID=A0A840Q2L8_9PSEU|nr:hypothetical protein [Saccharopolyspora phatthalungensis]